MRRNLDIALVFFILAVVVLVAAMDVRCQSTTQIGRKCPGASPSPATATVTVSKPGDVTITPCSGRTITHAGTNAFSGKLKLFDSTYVPVLPTATTYFTLGSATAINSSDQFLGTIFDLKVNQSSSGHVIEGSYLNLNVAGSHTNDFMTGSFMSLSNVGDTGTTNHLTTLNIFNNIERTAADGYGIDVFSALGGSGADATGKVVGIRSIAGAGHGANTPLAIAGDFEIDTQGNGNATASLTNLLRLVYTNRAGETITDAKGLFIGGWSNVGTVGTTSCAICIDTTVDTFATSNLVINSLAVSPSFFAGKHTFDVTNTTAGTTGNQTINKPSFSVNFAAASSSLTVTNSFITANSYVLCTVQTNDATALFKNATPAAGSVVIRLNANATAETRVACLVTN